MGAVRAIVAALAIALLIPMPMAEAGVTVEVDPFVAHRATATPIAPGEYSGVLVRGANPYDYYSFEVAENQTLLLDFDTPRGSGYGSPALALVLDPTGHVHGYDLGGFHPARIALGTAGTWYIVAKFYSPVTTLFPDALLPAWPYSFSFDLVDVAHGYTSTATAGWHVVEAATVSGSTIGGSVTFDLPHYNVDPGSYRMVLEGFQGAHTISISPGVGSDVQVLGVDPIEDGEVPGLRVLALESTIVVQWSPFATKGAIRLSMFSADGPLTSSLTLTSDTPLRFAAAHGDDVVAWDGADGGLRAPGMSMSGPARTELEVPERFFGVVNTRGTEGVLTLPSGEEVALSDEIHTISDGAPGRYVLQVDGATSAGIRAQEYFLQGALLPRFGIY